jgi:hypothetical protein
MNELTISYKKQRMRSWCWAATAAMVYEYATEVEIKDCQIATVHYEGIIDCCPFNVKCNRGLKLSHFQYLLKTQLILDSETIYNSLLFSEIIEKIDDDEVIIAITIDKDNGMADHALIISGYFHPTNQIIILDPALGRKIISYEDFVHGRNPFGQWGMTITVRRRIK